MARPAKKDTDRLTTVFSTRLTAGEAAAADARRAAAGLTRGEYTRAAVLNGRVSVRRTAKADPAIVAQLLRIGVNLNQIARTANATGGVPDNLDRLCRTVEAAVMKAIAPEAEDDGPDDRQ